MVPHTCDLGSWNTYDIFGIPFGQKMRKYAKKRENRDKDAKFASGLPSAALQFSSTVKVGVMKKKR